MFNTETDSYEKHLYQCFKTGSSDIKRREDGQVTGCVRLRGSKCVEELWSQKSDGPLTKRRNDQDWMKEAMNVRWLTFICKESRLWIRPRNEGQRLHVFVCPESSFTDISAVSIGEELQRVLHRREPRPKQGRRKAGEQEMRIKSAHKCYRCLQCAPVYSIFL